MTDAARRIARSFRFRILLGYALIVSLVAAAWVWSLFGPLTDVIAEQQQAHLRGVAQAGALALGRSDVPPPEVARELVAATDLRVTVVAADGRVLADSHEDPSRMEDHGARPEVATAIEGRVGADIRLSETLGIRQMYVAVPATFEGARVALRVAEPLTRIEELASNARRGGLLLLAAAIVSSLVLTARLAKRAAEPVARLTNAARRMAEGDLSTSVRSEPGELGVLSAALSDLKGQLRARVSMLEAERADLRAVLDGLSEAVFLVEDGHITVANERASRMFRAPARGWRGRAVAETPMPASLAATIEGLLRRGAGAEEVGEPARARFLVRVTELPASDRSSRALVVVSDITERTRLEAMRRDFVANASHELKTPISALGLLAQSARAAADDGDTVQALAFVSEIQAETTRLQRLVQELLDLARLEAAPGPAVSTDLRPVIDLAVTAHAVRASRKGIRLTVDLSAVAGRDLYVAADPTDLAVLFDNLLDNAVKYTEEGSVTLRVTADAGHARIEIEDTGVGIPEWALPRVFERFYRADAARSGVGGGSGLGLALVKHVAERSGGEIELTSSVGSGTIVTVALPLSVEAGRHREAG